MPQAREWDENEHLPGRDAAPGGCARLRRHLRRRRCRRFGALAARRRHHLRGTGAGLSLDRRLHLHPQHGGMDDRQLWQRRAAPPLAAGALHHASSFGELLPDRARLRLRRREPQDPRAYVRATTTCSTAPRRSSPAAASPTSTRDGAHRGGRAARHLVLRGRERHARAVVRRAREEARLEVAADRHGDLRRLPRAGREPLGAEGQGFKIAMACARRRPAQHRGLLARRRAVLPRPDHRLHARAPAVRHAARRLPGARLPHRRLRHRSSRRRGCCCGARRSRSTAARPLATRLCAQAKRLATDTGFDVVNGCLQLHGGYGYLRDHPIERVLRDLRVHQILEGTNEIMRHIVSRDLLTN